MRNEIETVYIVDIYHDDALHSFQRDETQLRQLELYETTFNIIHNNDLWVVVWTVDNIECSIFVDCSEDDLYKILKSIYEMEETE